MFWLKMGFTQIWCKKLPLSGLKIQIDTFLFAEKFFQIPAENLQAFNNILLVDDLGLFAFNSPKILQFQTSSLSSKLILTCCGKSIFWVISSAFWVSSGSFWVKTLLYSGLQPQTSQKTTLQYQTQGHFCLRHPPMVFYSSCKNPLPFFWVYVFFLKFVFLTFLPFLRIKLLYYWFSNLGATTQCVFVGQTWKKKRIRHLKWLLGRL